jgi:oligopeptide/dipeptide ABC transporter ATP-binding protein
MSVNPVSEADAGTDAGQGALVEIRDLVIGIQRTRTDRLIIVDAANFDIGRAEILGLVGESGSGKTMVCRSLIGTLRRRSATIFGGSIMFDGMDLATLDERRWRAVRGNRIGYVPQSALTGPNPVMTVGAQLSEAVRCNRKRTSVDARKRAMELLDLVHIRRPEVVFEQYPFQLSGGMRQRVMIAAAIAQDPDIIVADEPTTGLDVTVQAEIMNLLKEIRSEFRMSVVLVSHDLALIDEVCDRLVVMHAGTCVEVGGVADVSSTPKHPYTIALNRSRIDLAVPGAALVTIKGNPPAVGEWPSGCRFSDRCDFVQQDCRVGPNPPLAEVSNGHWSACIHADSLGDPGE